MTVSPGIIIANDCLDTSEHLLDTIDSCVAFAEGVDMQTAYEEENAAKQDYKGLTEKEVVGIRKESTQESTSANENYFPTIGNLNLCGKGSQDVVVPEEPQPPKDEAELENPPSPKEVPSPKETALHCAICFDEPKSTKEPTSVEHGGNTPQKNGGAEEVSIRFAYLPCCGAEGKEERSTTKICESCIYVLCTPTMDGSTRIGRCPRCRSWIAVTPTDDNDSHDKTKGGIIIEAVSSAGKCRVCNQVKSHLVEHGEVCDACFLGMGCPLVYSCKECGGQQRIPHPMYRYQPSVGDFGTTSWACHGRCQNFTMWRILADQAR